MKGGNPSDGSASGIGSTSGFNEAALHEGRKYAFQKQIKKDNLLLQ